MFQSTLPMKGATSTTIRSAPIRIVSIHAPNEGSDSASFEKLSQRHVSIHAPNEGSDLLATSSLSQSILFQSTLPMKGATAFGSAGNIQHKRFNPRSQ